ncbi:MAG TPA: toast rack family protein [Methanospirillum sp.]|uniref:toast rack family protein n=1 Tax=Methanospirillum sp. TaxID=45200 RepID=UPI002D052DC8|nr:toast rack family protein [Methanospirillum sp.]HWQ64580.1 toast rack family protein [Methanospirillum sp.]
MTSGISFPPLRKIIIWLFIISVISFTIGAIITAIEGNSYKSQYQSKVTPVEIESGKIDHAIVTLEMDSGSINLSENYTTNLISGSILGGHAQKGPDISYTSMDKVGHLNLKQESSMCLDPLSKEDQWDLALGQKVPTSLSIIMNTGNLRIQPGNANLTDLSIKQGTGDLILDLSGWSGTHLMGSIEEGIGSMTILLPVDASIATHVENGIGSRSILGLDGEKGTYFHAVQDRQAPVISLSVNQGIGDLTMKVVNES